jgi:hypothetical protein
MVGVGYLFTGQNGRALRFYKVALDLRVVLFKCRGTSGKRAPGASKIAENMDTAA